MALQKVCKVVGCWMLGFGLFGYDCSTSDAANYMYWYADTPRVSVSNEYVRYSISVTEYAPSYTTCRRVYDSCGRYSGTYCRTAFYPYWDYDMLAY